MDWHQQSEEAKKAGVCHTEEECKTGYAELSEDKKLAAHDCIRRELPEKTQEKIREAISDDPIHWNGPYHLGWGMAMRNMLRDKGFGEEYFGIDNLDCIYKLLIEDALKVTNYVTVA